MKFVIVLLFIQIGILSRASVLGDIYLSGKVKSFDEKHVEIVDSENQIIRITRKDIPPKMKLKPGAVIHIPIKDTSVNRN